MPTHNRGDEIAAGALRTKQKGKTHVLIQSLSCYTPDDIDGSLGLSNVKVLIVKQVYYPVVQIHTMYRTAITPYP